MPREHRKRGKKNKQKSGADEERAVPPSEEAIHTGESAWIRSAPSEPSAEISPEAPFGFVDVEVKAYFRTVDIQIRDWQDTQPEDAASDDVDPNERMQPACILPLIELTIALSRTPSLLRCRIDRNGM